MRRLITITCLLTSVVPATGAELCPSDSLSLTVARGPAADQVTLSWTGAVSPVFHVYRSSSAAAIVDTGSLIGTTSDSSWIDSPSDGVSVFYAAFRDYDQDGVDACLDSCDSDPAKLEPGACGCSIPDIDSDGDLTFDCLDRCTHDPDKTDRGICGCGIRDSLADSDGDGVIDCKDQCPGQDDRADADHGGLPDACDPCPTGLCPLTLPDRFYIEFPDIQMLRVSRDGRLLAGRVAETGQGVLIPTERLLASPGERSYFEFLPAEVVDDVTGISDDNNLVLANIFTRVPEAPSTEVSAAAIYDRANGAWRLLGLYDDAINVAGCRFYSNSADITSDGNVVYGRTPSVERPCGLVGFRHDLTSGEWQLFGGPNGAVRLVEGASGDGGVIVGSETGNGASESPVHWYFDPPSLFTPQWLGYQGIASDLTFDGAAVALTHAGLVHRWTESAGLELLGAGTLDPAWHPKTAAIDDGGSIVLGNHSYLIALGKPFIWVQGAGFGSLIDYLQWRGHTNLGGMNDNYLVHDVSGNGRIIVGIGQGFAHLPGWVVVTTHP